MKGKLRIAVSLALALALALCSIPMAPAAEAAGYTPPFTTVRIGLYTYQDDGNISERNFPSNNLQNVTGAGWGFEFGYFDGQRNFVPFGARVEDTNEVSVILDRNMVYSSASNSYIEGDSGAVVVGCYHLRLDGSYADYASARAAADTVDGGFVRYQNGEFLVMMGSYRSADEAASARAAAGISCAADSGSAYTVTVVQTRTNRILFEFDCGSRLNLAVRPIADEGVKAQTWHRKCIYYGDFVFMRNTGGNITVVNYVNIEDYLKGVVCYEMSPSWPIEALKAQAVTARTYLMAHTKKHSTEGFEICNTVHCQAYHGVGRATANSDMAVDLTAGQYLTYDGLLCDTYYASSNGGASENSENVWSLALPYLRGVADPYEADIAGTAANYYWQKTYTPSSLGAQLRAKHYNSSDVVKVDMTFTDMGNVYSITFTDRNGVRNTVSKADVRTIIGGLSIRYTVNGLGPSAGGALYVNEGIEVPEGLEGAYAIGGGGIEQLPTGELYAVTGSGTVEKLEVAGTAYGKSVSTGVNSSGNFVFSGTGWGHNVGMSQWGAYSMAKYYGKTYEDILTFYYTGAQITNTLVQ